MRVLILGGPLRGKSTLARELRAEGLRTFCTDAPSYCREVEYGVTYLPEGLVWSGASQYVADQWLSMPGPWVIEGAAAVRALRKWAEANPDGVPADRIVMLVQARAPTTGRQEGLAKGVVSVWREICQRFDGVTEHR